MIRLGNYTQKVKTQDTPIHNGNILGKYISLFQQFDDMDTKPFVGKEKIPHSHTDLRLDRQSTTEGWVTVEQCHQGLDAVPSAEVVYRFVEMRRLRVIQAENIEKAWVEGQSVQLKNVANGAHLCVALQARLLHRTDNDNYRMNYGPFQRRFLDSYFPMHVTLEVDYTNTGLRFSSVIPKPVL